MAHDRPAGPTDRGERDERRERVQQPELHADPSRRWSARAPCITALARMW